MSPLVSVIIPTYNYAHFLPEAIQSVLDQDFCDYEIIIVDDGSTDGTREIIKQYENRIQYIYKLNSGPNNSRNVGILASKGKYIAFLDADDKWVPSRLLLQVPILEKNEKIGLVYATVISFDTITNAYINNFPSSRCHRGNVIRKLYMDQFVSSPTVLIRRSVFSEVGLFDESRKYTDDWEMWLRISSKYEFDFISQPLALYRIHPSASSLQTPSYVSRITEMLSFFETAAISYPSLQPMKKKRFSTFLEQMGWRLFQRGEKNLGRSYLKLAIFASWKRIMPYFRFSLTFFYRSGISFDRYRRAEISYLHGKFYLFNLILPDARKMFLSSIRLNPFGRIDPYFGLILTILGNRMVLYVRRRYGLEYLVDSPKPSNSLSFTQW